MNYGIAGRPYHINSVCKAGDKNKIKTFEQKAIQV